MQAEGLELMLIILKARKLPRLGPLRVINFALTRFLPGCEKFVDVQGLKYVFAIFMGKIKVSMG